MVYTEVFRDDFTSEKVNTTKWNIVDAMSTVNNELQYYSPEDVWQGNISIATLLATFKIECFFLKKMGCYM